MDSLHGRRQREKQERESIQKRNFGTGSKLLCRTSDSKWLKKREKKTLLLWYGNYHDNGNYYVIHNLMI